MKAAFIFFAGVSLLTAATTQASITTTGELTAMSGVPYDGSDDPWATSVLIIGNNAPGTLAITGGSSVNNSGNGRIAFTQGSSTSAVTVTGLGSKFSNTGQLRLANNGTGTLTITDGGAVTSVGGIIGNDVFGNGTATVGGGAHASTWSNSDALIVGNNGTGTLNLNASGTVNATALDHGLGTSIINFNGGILSITGIDSYDGAIALFSGGGTFNIPTAGTIFSLSGGIGQLSGAGGLTKTGQATLDLGIAANYTGDTIVTSGILITSLATLDDFADVFLQTGSIFALNTGSSDEIDELWLGGMQVAAGTWGSSSSGAANVDDTFFTGNGMLEVINGPDSVPEPSTAAFGFILVGFCIGRRYKARRDAPFATGTREFHASQKETAKSRREYRNRFF